MASHQAGLGSVWHRSGVCLIRIRVPDKARQQIRSPTFNFYSENPSSYDEEFGYSYAPDTSGAWVKISNGYPVLCAEYTNDHLGNRGAGHFHGSEPAKRVLVLGDSFTANEQNGVTWSGLLHDRLEGELGRNIEMVNSARHGYGVLQMFDLAGEKIDQFQPDMVIFAFISDDLTRSRSWRYEAEFDGQIAGYKSSNILGGERVSLATTMLNPLLTVEWCESMLGSLQPDDPFLATATDQFLRIREKIWNVNFWSVTRSFLLDRVNQGDPYHSFRSQEQNLKSAVTLDIVNFKGDTRFIEAVANLKQSGCHITWSTSRNTMI